MRVFVQSLIALVLSSLSLAVVAHHSFAMFDQAKELKLHGVVKEFRWSNPHAFIQLMAEGDKVQGEWSVELTSPEHLARVGWRRGTLKAGDHVEITIHPMRDGSKGGQFLSGLDAKGAALATGESAPK